MTAVPSVPLLCPGGTVAVFASGPSLTPEDVEACRGTVDAAIAINDNHRLAPWADVLFSSDQYWWPYYLGVPGFTGLKFGLPPLTPEPEWGITMLQSTGDAGIEPNPTGLRTGRNSGAAAINLAVHLGATKILLLGYDMQRTGGKAHWFGDHPRRIRSDAPLDSFGAMFETQVRPLQQLGVTVLNCSRETALTAFPRVPLEQALCREVSA